MLLSKVLSGTAFEFHVSSFAGHCNRVVASRSSHISCVVCHERAADGHFAAAGYIQGYATACRLIVHVARRMDFRPVTDCTEDTGNCMITPQELVHIRNHHAVRESQPRSLGVTRSRSITKFRTVKVPSAALQRHGSVVPGLVQAKDARSAVERDLGVVRRKVKHHVRGRSLRSAAVRDNRVEREIGARRVRSRTLDRHHVARGSPGVGKVSAFASAWKIHIGT